MLRSRRRYRARRGLTLPEVLMAGLVTALIIGVLAGFMNFSHKAWAGSVSSGDAQTAAQTAMQTIAADIRAARSVVEGSSSSVQLTLQLPQYDYPVTRQGLAVPLQDGDVISYYLSDESGQLAGAGSILWRSVNGVPDAQWSMQEKTGQIVLSEKGLTFTYSPELSDDEAPTTITISMKATSNATTVEKSFETSQEVMLRNNVREGDPAP